MWTKLEGMTAITFGKKAKGARTGKIQKNRKKSIQPSVTHFIFRRALLFRPRNGSLSVKNLWDGEINRSMETPMSCVGCTMFFLFPYTLCVFFTKSRLSLSVNRKKGRRIDDEAGGGEGKKQSLAYISLLSLFRPHSYRLFVHPRDRRGGRRRKMFPHRAPFTELYFYSSCSALPSLLLASLLFAAYLKSITEAVDLVQGLGWAFLWCEIKIPE